MSAWTVPGPSRLDPGRATGGTGYGREPDCANTDSACADMATVHVPDRRKPHGRGACSRSGYACRVYKPTGGG